MTLIIIRISFRGAQEVIRAEMKAFIHWLKQTAKAHGLARQAIASASRPYTSPTNTTNPSSPAKSPPTASPAFAFGSIR